MITRETHIGTISRLDNNQLMVQIAAFEDELPSPLAEAYLELLYDAAVERGLARPRSI